MKLTGGRADRYCTNPPADTLGALFYGPDRGLARERAQKLASRFVPDIDDAFNVTILTSDDISSDPARLADEMAALSLLGDKRLIRLRLDHERQGLAIGKLIKEFDANPGRCAAKLIIEAGELTPRSHVRKAFEAAAGFTAIACYADTGADLANIVRDALGKIGEHGIGIDKDALTAWTPLLEGDRALARGEIEKMALYMGYGETAGTLISLADVHASAAGGQAGNIDEIINAAFSGRLHEADDAFRRAMSGKMHAAVILRSAQRHMTRLHGALAAMSGGASASDAMRNLRPPVFAMRKHDFESQLRLWSIPILDKIIRESLETEKRVKSAGAPVEALTGRLLNAIATIAMRRKR
ncbi:MAG: DNA polymerase III subunit delta [Robiginitomaculum sp.]